MLFCCQMLEIFLQNENQVEIELNVLEHWF